MKIHNAIRWQDNAYLFEFQGVHTEPVEYFHAHEGLEILYVLEGTGKYVINNRMFPLKPSTLVVVKPFQIHEIKVQVPPAYIRTLLKIKSSVIERFIHALPNLASAFHSFLEHKRACQVFYLLPDHASDLEGRFMQLKETLAVVPPSFRVEAVTLFSFQFFEYFVSRIYMAGPSVSLQEGGAPGPEELVGLIAKWIDKRYNLPFTLNDMAAELHFSANYLSRTFKERMGISITAFTNDKRLEEARMLLAIPSLTIEEIGRMTGFNYPSYFISLFKTKYGETPHRYRMRMKK